MIRAVSVLGGFALLASAFPLADRAEATTSVQQGVDPEERILALTASSGQEALVSAVREWPDAAREVFRQLLVAAEKDQPHPSRPSQLPGASQRNPLDAAERLARAYSETWSDIYLARQLALFRSLDPDQRHRKILADSLRRAGATAYTMDAESALRIWGESAQISASIPDSSGVARALGNMGAAFYAIGYADSAQQYLDQAYDQATASGDFRTAANALTILGNLSLDQGNLTRASQLYSRSVEVRRRTGDFRGLAADQHNLALVRFELGDLEGAREQFELARTTNRRHGYRSQEALNLVGLADVAMLAGEYSQAADLLAEALDALGDIDDRFREAEVSHRSGLLDLRRGAYGYAAATLSQAAARYESAARLADAAEASLDASIASTAAGQPDDALAHLAHAEELAEKDVGGTRLRADIELAKADLSVWLNDPEEADRNFARAASLYLEAGDSRGQAEAREGAAYLLLLREDYAQAVTALEVLERAPSFRVDPRGMANLRLMLAYAREQAGDIAGARRALSESAEGFRDLGEVPGEALVSAIRGDLERRAGFFGSAESYYLSGLDRLSQSRAPGTAWRLHAGLGQVYERRGDLEAASREFGAAVETIEAVAGTVGAVDLRSGYLADKWEVYAHLALTEHRAGRSGMGFMVSERMRARRMLSLLAGGRIAIPESSSTGLMSREQDLRHFMRGLAAEPDAAGLSPIDRRHAASVTGYNEEAPYEILETARREHSIVIEEIRKTAPKYANLVIPEEPTWREAAGTLPPQGALLEYLVGDSTTLAFVLTGDTIVSFDLGVNRASLRALVDFARTFIASPASPGDPDGRELWRVPLGRLYQHLLAPIEDAGLLAGVRRLTIIPHAELHYLPFQALMSAGQEEQFLVERYDVNYAPSVSVWLRLQGRSRRLRAQRALGWRTLALAPAEGELPATRREVMTVEHVLGEGTDVFSGGRATETRLRREAPSHDIIHVASRGIVNRQNPLYSYIELSPDKESDGRLEVQEVFGLDLDARLVVLSACETALGSGLLGDVPAGDDWIGLVRAFHFAGASNVLATLWRVEDRATADLMERFYVELRGGASPASALARAQRERLRDPDTREPFYWAAFTLSGSGS
jgi:CHAT domain-containing protein